MGEEPSKSSRPSFREIGPAWLGAIAALISAVVAAVAFFAGRATAGGSNAPRSNQQITSNTPFANSGNESTQNPTGTQGASLPSPTASSSARQSTQASTLTWKGEMTIPNFYEGSYTDLSQPALAPGAPAPFNISDNSSDNTDIATFGTSSSQAEIKAYDDNQTYMIEWSAGGTPGFSQCRSSAQGGADDFTVDIGETFCFVAPNNTVGELTVLSIDGNGNTLVRGMIWWPQKTS